MKKFRRVILILTLIIITGFAVSCNKTNTGSADSPSKVVNDFTKALISRDYDKAWSCISEKSKENTEGRDIFETSFNTNFDDNPDLVNQLKSTKVIKETINGNKAAVEITYEANVDELKTKFTKTMNLVKEKDQWKLDLTKLEQDSSPKGN